MAARGDDLGSVGKRTRREHRGRVETPTVSPTSKNSRAAVHFPQWAIAHTENGFVSAEELVEAIREVRKVGTIYSKDFSELTGARAVMITA